MQRHRDLVAAVQADPTAMNAAFQGLLSRRTRSFAGTRSVVQRVTHTKISQLVRSPIVSDRKTLQMLADYIGIFSF
jgi:hypothetical protein